MAGIQEFTQQTVFTNPDLPTDTLSSKQFNTLVEAVGEGEIEGSATASKAGLTKGTDAYNNAFKKDIFLEEKKKAKEKVITYDKLSKIIGCEIDKHVFDQAKVNISLAGFENHIELLNDDFTKIQFKSKEGLILCNPPYGKKLGNENELINLYESMGEFLKKNFSGWEFWLLSGNPRLTRYLKMKSTLKIPVSNGGIDCRWIKYSIR
mgnify:CR=1 FL=1